MKIIKKLLGQAPANHAEPASSSQPHTVNEDSRLAGDGSHVATRRELVRVLARDVMRHNGVPEGWVDCQVMVVSTRNGQVHLYPRLTLKHWDERLLRYAVAFERRLMAEVESFEPQAREWLRGITWQFDAPDCPYPELPAREFWAESGDAVVDLLDADPPAAMPVADEVSEVDLPQPPAAPPAPTAEEELQEDLAKLLAVRESDRAALRASNGSEPPNQDFSPTQPGRR